MDTRTLLKKVRKIEIKTKGLSKHLFSGEYHSAFKGRGMSFSEVREYDFGDDVRNIDWNVTARTGDPHVKIFEEERELTVMLLVDVSPSCFFGTTDQFKHEMITELCAVIAFSAIQNNDKVGLILFAEEVELYIPPKKGRKHILRIIRELLYHQSSGKRTHVGAPLTYLNNVIKKRCIAFLLSDFLDDRYDEALRVAAKRHDVVGCLVYDRHERALPDGGMLLVSDRESGARMHVDTSSRRVREAYARRFEENVVRFKGVFARSKSDTILLETGTSYVPVLHQFFKRRAR
ncbi:MAG: DUF58 domain-containing protein [Saprospiraceae bacterium]|nr:DUF58 domain-containing protein [Saprospiraceae bacterium]